MEAIRALMRRPVSAAVTIAALAVGLAATTGVFTVVDTVLLRPLPHPAPDRLVAIAEREAGAMRPSLVAPARLDDWQRQAQTFAALSGSYVETITDTSGPEPERLEGRRVLPRYFEVLGTAPLAGRTFIADEERFGGARAAIIGEGFWIRRYGRDPRVLGRQLVVGGQGFEIVGVMTRQFSPVPIDVWLPAQLPPMMATLRRARFVNAIGRMKADVSVPQAAGDLARVQQRLAVQYPETDRDWTATAMDLRESAVQGHQRTLRLLLSAVMILLLIIVANLAGLMLAHLQGRRRELALRLALGASATRAIGVFLREAVVMTGVAAALGIAGAALVAAMLSSTFVTMPRLAEITTGWRTTLFTLGVGAAAIALFGLLPAVLTLRRLHPTATLYRDGARMSGEAHRLHAILVVAQVAGGLALTTAGGLLVQSYINLQRVDGGFSADGIVAFRVGAAWDEDRARVGRLQEQIVRDLGSLPGVTAVGIANFLPGTGGSAPTPVTLEGFAAADAGQLSAGTRIVSAGYLQALRVPLLAGEWCPDLRMDFAAPRTAMVNRRFATMAGDRVVGRALRMGRDSAPFRITGVVDDLGEDGPVAAPAPYVYMCESAGVWPDPRYVVRTAGARDALARSIAQVVHRADPARAVFSVMPLDELLARGLEQPRLNAQAVSLLSVVTLVLTALGLYSLLTLRLVERLREIGIRVALGATRARLVWLLFAHSARLVGTGIFLGIGASLVAASLLRGVLFGTAPIEWPVFALAVLVLLVVAVVATAWPAWRAARVDPAVTLRFH